MSAMPDIKLDHLGIGTILNRYRLTVPLNQREYSWTKDEVDALFDDLQKAIDGKKQYYFLGAIALTGPNQSSPDVSDGQQRLATIALFLAAIRDYFSQAGDDSYVDYVETTFLTVPEPGVKGRVPRLTLNVDDRDFFGKVVARKPGEKDRVSAIARTPSNERIKVAFERATKRVETIIAVYKKEVDQVKRLRAWIDFIHESALVISVRLPSEDGCLQDIRDDE